MASSQLQKLGRVSQHGSKIDDRGRLKIKDHRRLETHYIGGLLVVLQPGKTR